MPLATTVEGRQGPAPPEFPHLGGEGGVGGGGGWNQVRAPESLSEAFLYNPIGTGKKGADWVRRAKGWSLQIQGPGASFCFL